MSFVERVARGMTKVVGIDPDEPMASGKPMWMWYEKEARAAIAICREEAVKVAREYPKRDPAGDGNGYWAASEIADALSKMGEE